MPEPRTGGASLHRDREHDGYVTAILWSQRGNLQASQRLDREGLEALHRDVERELARLDGRILWMAGWSTEDETSSGDSLVSSEGEANALAHEWFTQGAPGVFVAQARLCDENDPDLYAYDNEREHYFALVTPKAMVN